MTATLSLLRPNVRHPDARRDFADAQQIHRTIMAGFGQAQGPARATFGVLYRLDFEVRGPELLIQSTEVPDWSRLPYDYLVEPPRTRPLDPLLSRLQAGSGWRFRLLANPTKDAARREPDGRLVSFGRKPLTSEAERLIWLSRKASAAGFEVLEARTSEPAGSRSEGRVRGLAPRVLTGVCFDGVVRVIDQTAAMEAVISGIGRGKAYGYGLMSLAPAGR